MSQRAIARASARQKKKPPPRMYDYSDISYSWYDAWIISSVASNNLGSSMGDIYLVACSRNRCSVSPNEINEGISKGLSSGYLTTDSERIFVSDEGKEKIEGKFEGCYGTDGVTVMQEILCEHFKKEKERIRIDVDIVFNPEFQFGVESIDWKIIE